MTAPDGFVVATNCVAAAAFTVKKLVVVPGTPLLAADIEYCPAAFNFRPEKVATPFTAVALTVFPSEPSPPKTGLNETVTVPLNAVSTFPLPFWADTVKPKPAPAETLLGG